MHVLVKKPAFYKVLSLLFVTNTIPFLVDCHFLTQHIFSDHAVDAVELQEVAQHAFMGHSL